MGRFFPTGVAMGVLFSDLLPVLRLWSIDGINLSLLTVCLVFSAIRAIGAIGHITTSEVGTMLSTRQISDMRP